MACSTVRILLSTLVPRLSATSAIAKAIRCRPSGQHLDLALRDEAGDHRGEHVEQGRDALRKCFAYLPKVDKRMRTVEHATMLINKTTK